MCVWETKIKEWCKLKVPTTIKGECGNGVGDFDNIALLNEKKDIG